MNESKASLFPQAWDKGGRIHLEDNITQQPVQVCTPTSLHKTMHMNEIFHLHEEMCGVHAAMAACVRKAKGRFCITELLTVVHDLKLNGCIFISNGVATVLPH